MQSDIVQCSLCAKLSPNMEQTAARTAAQIGCTMQCRECGRTYETQAAEITRLTEALRAAEEREKALLSALEEWMYRYFWRVDGMPVEAARIHAQSRMKIAALAGAKPC